MYNYVNRKGLIIVRYVYVTLPPLLEVRAYNRVSQTYLTHKCKIFFYDFITSKLAQLPGASVAITSSIVVWCETKGRQGKGMDEECSLLGYSSVVNKYSQLLSELLWYLNKALLRASTTLTRPVSQMNRS